LHERENPRGSFIPSIELREMRELARARIHLPVHYYDELSKRIDLHGVVAVPLPAEPGFPEINSENFAGPRALVFLRGFSCTNTILR
jgi:hypothetical protein